MKNIKAFTIIELLVVISIIAMLAAIVLPALSQSRKRANAILCASNLRQAYLAMQGYAAHNDDEIIYAREILSVHSLEEALGCWNIAILPYIDIKITNNVLANRAEVWICPEDKDPYPFGFKNCPHNGMTSYALNGYYKAADESGRQIRLGPAGLFQFCEISQPAECFLLGETSYASQFYDADADSTSGYNLPRDGHHRNTSGFYHNGAMNVLFVDGHIEKIKGEQDGQEVWPEGFEAIYQSGRYMYWAELSLPSANEKPAFWGPGY